MTSRKRRTEEIIPTVEHIKNLIKNFPLNKDTTFNGVLVEDIMPSLINMVLVNCGARRAFIPDGWYPSIHGVLVEQLGLEVLFPSRGGNIPLFVYHKQDRNKDEFIEEMSDIETGKVLGYYEECVKTFNNNPYKRDGSYSVKMYYRIPDCEIFSFRCVKSVSKENTCTFLEDIKNKYNECFRTNNLPEKFVSVC